jgi:hypothetical protein
LRKHQEDFKCHVCGKPSPAPNTFLPNPTHPIVPAALDWESPTHLERCVRCHEWTCDDHIYKRVCRTCAETL